MAKKDETKWQMTIKAESEITKEYRSKIYRNKEWNFKRRELYVIQ